MAITFVQPGANAALAPERAIDLSREALVEPMTGIGEAGIGETGVEEPDVALSLGPVVAPLTAVGDILSNAATVEFPKTGALDTASWSIAIPMFGDASLKLYGAVPEQPKAPVVSLPEPAKKQAALTPDDGVSAKGNLNVERPQARPATRIDQIKFSGPAGTPFAHIRFCLKYPDECREQQDGTTGLLELTEERRRELQRVNLDVNRSINPTRAFDETAATEKWLIAPENGDCNDYAVTKRSRLIAQGWPSRALLLAEVIVPSGEGHLVVVVRTDKGDMVLDNLNANIRLWSKTGYQWVRVESPENPQFWSKVATPPAAIASIGNRDSRL